MNDTTIPPGRRIELHRRFVESNAKKAVNIDEDIAHLLSIDRSIALDDLLKKRRVVVLAEAGSGKTTEFQAAARALRDKGEVVFEATLQNIGQKGFEAALRAGSMSLAAWRDSTQAAWFFLDSVDEAKHADVRLADALRAVKAGIAGASGRAHLILSGRHSDWEFTRDLEDFEDILPLPPEDAELPILNAEAHLVQVLRHEEPQEAPPAEKALIVLMAPLTEDQVKHFARGKGVEDGESFLKAIGRADLWRFARRPLDLGWLIDYWRSKGAFGTLNEMLDVSLRERLKEPDLHRRRRDPLDAERAYRALMRVGAALVLQRQDYVLIPDGALELGEARSGLALDGVLPDWPADHVARLISRPVFDPVVAGLVRLHHDNEGEVRGYLAARWLKMLIDEHYPRSTINALLFAQTYGLSLVIPSRRQTAAWLSLWDRQTAREVLRRDPMLLMQAGDPGSLPLSVRESILRETIAGALRGEKVEIGSHNHLQRFARPDMAPLVRKLWSEHYQVRDIRVLLLEMIELGELTACADIAEEATRLSDDGKSITAVFAGRALLATAGAEARERYAERIRSDGATLAPAAVWEAVEELFPREITVDHLLALIDTLDLTTAESLSGRLLGKLTQKLESLADLERLLAGLLARLDLDEEAEEEPNDTLRQGIEAAAERMLMLVGAEQSPALVLEGVFRSHQLRQHYRKSNEALLERVNSSRARRRAMFWHAAHALAGHEHLRGGEVKEYWQFRGLGFVPTLADEDLQWLVKDAVDSDLASDRALATDAALWLRATRDLGAPALAKIQAIVASRPELQSVLDGYLSPRVLSRDEQASKRETAHIERRNTIRQAQIERSWVKFAAEIRANPEVLSSIPPPTSNTMDRRLFELWKLLTSVGSNRNHYAIDNLDVLEPVLGQAALEPLRQAFIRFWRHWKPTLASERPVSERNLFSVFDGVGMVGITLEAAANPHWTDALTETDARRAAGYATVELNGFAPWITALAQRWPEAVRAVLTRELVAELEELHDPVERVDVLQDLEHADITVQRLVVPYLDDLVRRKAEWPDPVRRRILKILVAASTERATLAKLLLERARKEKTPVLQADYLGHAFTLAPVESLTVLRKFLAGAGASSKRKLIEGLLPRLTGDRWEGQQGLLRKLPFEVLRDLVGIGYEVIRIDEDNVHPGNRVIRANERDAAEDARSAIFRALVETPGAATFAALQHLRAQRGFPISAERMEELMVHRAGEDSEPASWGAGDLVAFEQDKQLAPRSAHDLHRLALRFFSDMQYDLLNEDFGQGRTLAGLPDEREVQIWIADFLQTRQGRSFSVERESHVADEKAPDVRLRAKASDARVPIEIKVTTRWSLPDLERALVDQLVGRYLRDRNNRWGILLLVHQRARRGGWHHGSRTLTVDQVVDHLRTLAQAIATKMPDSPQPSVVLIDVSAAAPKRPRAGVSRPNRTVTKKGPAKSKRRPSAKRKATRSRKTSAVIARKGRSLAKSRKKPRRR